MTSPTETREAVARTIREAISADGPCWLDANVADAILSEHIAPLATEIERLRAERDAAINDRDESVLALEAKVAALAPHGSCACSYDRPGDVCAHHSPVLSAALSEVSRLTAALAESERQGAVMREALAKTKTQPALKAPTWDEAVTLARRAIYDTDGRGMIARNRNHLHERVAREIFNATRALKEPTHEH